MIFIFMLIMEKKVEFHVVGVSKHTCASLCRLLKVLWSPGPTQDPCVSFCYISPKNTLCISLMMSSLEVRGWWGRENRLRRKFELYVLYVSRCRTAPTPQPHSLATRLPLCPQHLLLRSTMRRRCHWALEPCRNTLSPEVSSLLLW